MAYEIPGQMLGCFPADVDMTLNQFNPVFITPAVNCTGYGQGGSAVTLNAAVTTTASTTSGSPTITVASATGLEAGQTVTGTGIPANTTISSISGTTVTLSANATATGTGVAISAQFAGSGSAKFPLGIVQNNPKVAEAANVMTTGVSKCKSVGTFNAGDLLTFAAGGVVKATTGTFAFARALEAAVSGDITSVELKNFGVQ